MTKTQNTPEFAGATYAGLAPSVSAAQRLVQIQTAIQTALDAIDGLHTSPYIPEQVTPPEAVVGVPPIEYHKAFKHGLLEADFTVILVVSKAYDRVGQAALGEFADIAGDKSIHAAIEAASTDEIGMTVMSFRPLATQEVGVLGFYGGEFTVKVLAKGA